MMRVCAGSVYFKQTKNVNKSLPVKPISERDIPHNNGYTKIWYMNYEKIILGLT